MKIEFCCETMADEIAEFNNISIMAFDVDNGERRYLLFSHADNAEIEKCFICGSKITVGVKEPKGVGGE